MGKAEQSMPFRWSEQAGAAAVVAAGAMVVSAIAAVVIVSTVCTTSVAGGMVSIALGVVGGIVTGEVHREKTQRILMTPEVIE